MRDELPDWSLKEFLERLDAWAELDDAPDDLRLLVTGWIMTRYDDPYSGVERADGFENLWYGVVPHSDNGHGSVVVCSYWIHERDRTVVCDSFATLSLPI